VTDASLAVREVLDPALFSRRRFTWDPYLYQRELLDQVLLQDKRRIAWVAGRRVGKTEGVANLVLQLAVRRPGIDVVIFAPSMRQAKVLSRKIRYMLAGSPWEEAKTVDNVGELRLSFGRDDDGKPVESTILTMSLSGKARGEGADVLVIDESAFCDPEDYRNKALRFVVDREDAVIVHISTVWAEDDHFMQAYQAYSDLEHGFKMRTPTREKPGVTEAILEEFRAEMLRSEYEREYECNLVPEGGVFDRRALKQCLMDYEMAGLRQLGSIEAKPKHLYTVGVDWGKFEDQSVVAVLEQSTQRKRNPGRLVLLEVYEPDPDDDSHYTTVLQDVQRVAEHFRGCKVVADQGEGAHQAEMLERELGGLFVGFRFTRQSRDFLVDNLRYLVEKQLIELPIEPDEVRRCFLNVAPGDDGEGYEHASRELKDVFDAIGLAASEMSVDQGRDMQVLASKPHHSATPRTGRRKKHGLR
jgi:hypothetical protein